MNDVFRRNPMLALSMGDPAGIGPEVILKAATVADVRAVSNVVVFGDPLVLERAAHDASVSAAIIPVEDVASARLYQAVGEVPVVTLSRLDHVPWGKPTRESDGAQVSYIREATQSVLRGQADALVTAPVSKAAFSRAGVPWAGHTEMLADLCRSSVRAKDVRSEGRGVDDRGAEDGSAEDRGVEDRSVGDGRRDRALDPVMMLVGPTLKVVPLTRHVALSAVPKLIVPELVLHAIEVTDAAFRRHFARHQPRIAIAGLNPHAGEGGMFGREEEEVILPAVREASKKGIHVSGPHPPDAIYRRTADGEFDVVIGMYHDQALIPLKLLDFDVAVNVTLGLPLVRTSVDHGTAYDIAGQGVASAHSMMAAMNLAGAMVARAEETSAAEGAGAASLSGRAF
ncbi:MAG: 4-hydroxythreonine-4-phosphate dehydrogenase PdxA [Deltaproteobacteria bacterium]|nr:4-hydroxythreonine-4-phosphate dehydrogenase PdxA [Deltaproteobacteria bacterium]